MGALEPAVATKPAPQRAPAKVTIRPQEGPQERFLSSDADIVVYGGSAFSGKTFGMLLDDLYHYHDADYASVTFRRETTQIRNPGGLWDEACRLFAAFGARQLGQVLEQVFPSGAVAKFAHLEHADSVYAWDGAQIPVLKFDQLESFEASQFWYMLTRNRDPSGKIRPYCRATCNPRPGWLAELLAWWIDQDTGYAIWERSGVIRWFVRLEEQLHWGDSREELFDRFKIEGLPEEHPDQPRPMSITFIPGRIWDNKIGLQKDPGYLSKLKAQQRVERERLLGDPQLGGNWKVSPGAGNQFSRHWCATLEAEPGEVEWVRGWDLAATRPSEASPDPDWTVGVRLGRYRSNRRRFVIAPDVARLRTGPAGVEAALKNVAEADGPATAIRLPQDPGQAGKSQAAAFTGMLAGYKVRVHPVTGDKVTRFGPFSAQAEAGNVDLVKGIPEAFLASLENFPEGVHDDDADAVSEAFGEFSHALGGANIIEYYRRLNEAARAAAAAQVEGAQPGVAAITEQTEAAKANGGNGSTTTQTPEGQVAPSPSPATVQSTTPVEQAAPPATPVRRSSSFLEAAELQGRSGAPDPVGAPRTPASVYRDGNSTVTRYIQGSPRR